MTAHVGPGADRARTIRRASLRRQVALMEHVRDTVAREPGDDFARWMDALVDLTDDLLHELMELEGVPPYPHPRKDRWWVDVASPTALAHRAVDAPDIGHAPPDGTP